MSYPKQLLQRLYLGWAPVASYFSEGSPRSAGMPDPDSFQMTISALGHRACEISCALFKSEVSIFCNTLEHLQVNPTNWQRQTISIQDIQAGEPMWAWESFLPMKNLEFSYSLHSPRGMTLDYTLNPILLPILLLSSFFIILIIEDLFWQLLVFFISSYSANNCNFDVLVRGDHSLSTLISSIYIPVMSFMTYIQKSNSFILAILCSLEKSNELFDASVWYIYISIPGPKPCIQ